jgi:hypothetical protein
MEQHNLAGLKSAEFPEAWLFLPVPPFFAGASPFPRSFGYVDQIRYPSPTIFESMFPLSPQVEMDAKTSTRVDDEEGNRGTGACPLRYSIVQLG